MPNRYVREDAIESEAVNRLSWQSEVFWRRLLNRVDDFGRFTANKELLRASLFPLQLSKVPGAEIGKMLLECEQSGLLSTWRSDGKDFLVLHKWEKGRALHSKFPEPPPEVRERMESFTYIPQHMSGNVPDPDSDSDPVTDSKERSITREQIESIGQTAGIPKEVCEAFFDSMQSVGWIDGRGRQIKSPPHALSAYWRHWQSNNAEKAAKNGTHPQRTSKYAW